MADQRRVTNRPEPEGAGHLTTSKIGVPGLPDWVIPRPRLMARLGRGSRGPLTVVTGAPGAGKTVAVASWAASVGDAGTAQHPVAWVTVDDGDRDPEVFWGYLLEAVRRAGTPIPSAGGSGFHSDGIDHVRVAELAAVLTRRERPVVLVLDDFHPAVGSVLVAGMAYLLKLARPWLRLVIISRRDLPLPLHRYRLVGDLTEIRADDLAFTERETDQLLAQHGVVLRRESVRALRDRTEGWAAGLRLAAMSMAGHPAPDEFVAQAVGGDHAIAGYLVEEVLDAQRPAVRLLLLNTSILDRVNAEIAVGLTPGIAETEFAEVVRQNAFIRPLGHGWYRYHQMFRDVLRLRLQHEYPGRTAALHRRAALWFSARGLLTEAVQHAAAGRDWRLACALVVDRLAVGDLLGLCRVPLLGAALDPMPAAAGWADLEPVLVVAALALARGDERGCRSALQRSAELLTDRPADDLAPARLTAALLRLVHAWAYHEAGAEHAAADVETLLDRVSCDVLVGRPDVRCVALAGRAGNQMWAGQWGQAADSLAAAHGWAVEATSSVLRFDCLAHSALVEVFRGRWGRAAELAAQAEGLAQAPRSPLGRTAAVLALVQGWIALQRYRLDDARRCLDQAGSLLSGMSAPLLTAVHGLASVQLDVAEGHRHRALDTLSRIRAVRSLPAWLTRRMVLAEVEVHTATGVPVAAWQAMIRAGGSQSPDGVVVLARAQLATGRPTAALRTLRPALTELAAVRSDVRVAAWLLDAQASQAVGNPGRGRRSLDRALRLGDREQVRLPFAAVKPWLRAALWADQDLARQYPRLLEPLRIGMGPAREGAGTLPARPVVCRRLSDRELEVLQHLAQMRTSEEIAIEMYVSINTVKTHLKSIYRKLAVTRRGDAVRRARQLQLLPGQRSEQAQLTGSPDGLGSGRYAQLAVDQAGVALDRVHRDE